MNKFTSKDSLPLQSFSNVCKQPGLKAQHAFLLFDFFTVQIESAKV